MGVDVEAGGLNGDGTDDDGGGREDAVYWACDGTITSVAIMLLYLYLTNHP